MATISQNGVSVEFNRDGRNVSFRVLAQSPQSTAIIKNNTIEVDGWSLKVNNRPDINREEKTFYLRGADAEKDNKTVIKSFDTLADAKAAEAVLPKLLAKVVGPAYEVVNGDKVTAQAARWAVAELRGLYSSAAYNGEAYLTALHRLTTSLRGPDNESEAKKKATTKIRQAIFNQNVAKTLKVTGKDEYPAYVTWTKGSNPPKIDNEHLAEHINQAWDVLDKAH